MRSAATSPVKPRPATRSAAAPLASSLPADWRAALSGALKAPTFKQLEAFLEEEARAGEAVFPSRENVFAALRNTPLKDVRVVVIGQDPYPTPGVANGLAFSVSPGVPIPASLANIFAGIQSDTGVSMPKAGGSGDLTPWAQRGVLLLNTVLTVRGHQPNSHKDKGWEPFTQEILRTVNEQPGPVVFLCFGAQAREMAKAMVDTRKHAIVATPHPSPRTGRQFLDAVKRDQPFQKVNEVLTRAGRGKIDWSLAAPPR